MVVCDEHMEEIDLYIVENLMNFSDMGPSRGGGVARCPKR